MRIVDATRIITEIDNDEIRGLEEKDTSDINEINRSYVNKRLLSLSNSYLENLRQEARIVFK